MDSGKDSVWVGGLEVMPLKLWFKAGLTPKQEQVAQDSTTSVQPVSA